MKPLKYIFLIGCSLSLVACQTHKAPKPAHLRAISMIQFTSATLTIHGKGKNKGLRKRLSVDYGEPTGYQELPPGYYEITLNAHGKDLLKGTYAVGKNGYYTLLAAGLLPEKWKVNPQTTLYSLTYTFAGEELESTNDYLPQWFMMRDHYGGSPKNNYLRLINANPHTPAISIKRNGQHLKSKLAYPVKSGMIKLNPGTQTFEFYYGKIKLGERKIHTKPGYIYTLIIGNKKASKDKLQVSVLKNPSRTLLKSK